jgi:hypothetical protein
MSRHREGAGGRRVSTTGQRGPEDVSAGVLVGLDVEVAVSPGVADGAEDIEWKTRKYHARRWNVDAEALLVDRERQPRDLVLAERVDQQARLQTATEVTVLRVYERVQRPLDLEYVAASTSRSGYLPVPSEIGGSATGAMFPKPVFPVYPGEW